MTSGAQKWLPIAARVRTQLQRRIDRQLARGLSTREVRRQAAAAISRARLPRLLEQATYDSLNFKPLAKGQKR